jgi:hypothetical protein
MGGIIAAQQGVGKSSPQIPDPFFAPPLKSLA